MNPYDLGGLGGLLAGFKQRLEDMKQKMAETEVSGEAGGGLVKFSLTCDYHVTSIEIGQEAFEDKELLEDLLRAAANEALRKAQKTTGESFSEAAGGLPTTALP